MSNTSLLGSYGSQAGTALTFKNRLINGDMKISQRFGTGNATLTTGSTYTVDRWLAFCTGAGGTASQVSASISGHTKALKVAPAAGNTYTEIIQRIEAVNIEDLVSSVVTFSGWVYVDNATGVTANVVAYTAGVVDDYNTNTQLTITNPGITLTSGSYVYVEKQITLPTNATNGIQVGVSFTGVASKDVRLTGASLESGPVATPFEHRPAGLELSLCQRYYERITADYTGAPIGIGGFMNTTTAAIINSAMAVPKRARASLETTGVASDYTLRYANNLFQIASAVPTASTITGPVIGMSINSSVSIAAGTFVFLRAASAGVWIAFDAEL